MYLYEIRYIEYKVFSSNHPCFNPLPGTWLHLPDSPLMSSYHMHSHTSHTYYTKTATLTTDQDGKLVQWNRCSKVIVQVYLFCKTPLHSAFYYLLQISKREPWNLATGEGTTEGRVSLHEEKVSIKLENI